MARVVQTFTRNSRGVTYTLKLYRVEMCNRIN